MIDELEQVGMKLCNDSVKDEHDTCVHWVQELKHGLENLATIKPFQACQTATMCAPEADSKFNRTVFGEDFFKMMSPFDESFAPRCEDCVEKIDDLKEELLSAKVISSINETISAVCEDLTEGDEEELDVCIDKASKHILYVVEIMLKIDSQSVCSVLGRCEPPKKIDHGVCQICLSTLKLLKKNIQKSGFDGQVKLFVEYFCNYFGGHDDDNCFDDINQVAHYLIGEILKANSGVCKQYNLCV